MIVEAIKEVRVGRANKAERGNVEMSCCWPLSDHGSGRFTAPQVISSRNFMRRARFFFTAYSALAKVRCVMFVTAHIPVDPTVHEYLGRPANKLFH